MVEIVRDSQTSKVHIMKSTAPYAQTGLRTFGDSSEIDKFDSRKVSVLKCTAALRCPFSDLGLSINLIDNATRNFVESCTCANDA